MSDERRERTIRIIKGLLEKRLDRGATPAEAAASVAKVQELLTRYQISMLDVEKKELKDNLSRFDFDTGKRKINPGEQSLASAVAAGYDCKLVIEPGRYGNSAKYVFLGYDSDVQIAQHCFIYLTRTLLKLADISAAKGNVYKQKLIRYRNNFLMVAAGIIRQRFLERKNNNLAPETVQSVNNNLSAKTTGSSLTLIKKPKVDDFVKTQYRNLVSRPQSKVKYNPNALEEGRKAGREIELNKVINVESTKGIKHGV